MVTAGSSAGEDTPEAVWSLSGSDWPGAAGSHVSQTRPSASQRRLRYEATTHPTILKLNFTFKYLSYASEDNPSTSAITPHCDIDHHMLSPLPAFWKRAPVPESVPDGGNSDVQKLPGAFVACGSGLVFPPWLLYNTPLPYVKREQLARTKENER